MTLSGKHNMNKQAVKKFAILFILFTFFYSNKLLAREITLNVGIYHNPPLVFYEGKAEPAGLFIDILEHIAKKENLKLKYRSCNWSECLELLKKGKIDVLPAIGYTRERARWAIFTDEDVIVNWAIVCRRKGVHIDSIPDLNGKTVAILKDDIFTAPFIEMTTAFDLFPRIRFYDNYEEIFNALSNGRVDAGVVNRLYESINISKFPAIEPTPIVFSPIKVKFALSKKTRSGKTLKPKIDKHLEDLKQDDSSIYYRSIDRWFGVPEKISIPSWIYLIIGLLSGLVISFFIAIYYLRRKVQLATEELNEKYDDLNQMRQYLEAIFQNTPDMIFVHDHRGRIIDINENVKKRYGFRLDEFQTLPPETMMGTGYTLEMAMKRLKRAIKGESQDFEWIARDRKGQEFPVEVRLRPFELTLLDGTKKRYVLSIVRDITDRKKTEEKLKISEQWFKTIFNAEPECVKILSPDGSLIDMNPAGLRMINAEDPDILVGQNLLCLVHEDFKEQYQRFIKELLEGKESSLEFKIKTFSGGSLWVDSHGTLIKDDDGKIKALLIVTRDITEKKHLQEELEKKVKERTEHLQRIINTMAEREVKVAELKKIIKQLKEQLKEAGLEPVADHSSKENDTQ